MFINLHLTGTGFFFFFKIFLTYIIFKVFTDFITTLFLFCVLIFWPRGMWDPSSLTGAWTHTPWLEGDVLTTGPPGKVSGSFSRVHSPHTWQEGDVAWQESGPHLKYRPEQWQEYKAHVHKFCQQRVTWVFSHDMDFPPAILNNVTLTGTIRRKIVWSISLWVSELLRGTIPLSKCKVLRISKDLKIKRGHMEATAGLMLRLEISADRGASGARLLSQLCQAPLCCPPGRFL